MKKLKFTKHAEQKLLDRNINKNSVKIAIEKPDELLIGKNNTKINHKVVNNKILRVEAVLIRLSKSKKRTIIIINAVVKIIENEGVPFSDTLENIFGRS